MREKIAMLLQHHFIEYCKKEIGDTELHCELSYIEYDSLEQLPQIFSAIKTEYDAFVISGELPAIAIQNIDTPPFAVTGYFGGYLENIYRLLLEQLLKREHVDAERIGLDYWDGRIPLGEILEKDMLPDQIRTFEQRLIRLSGRELAALENQTVEKYLRLCGEGRLDFVVTSFYRVVEALQREGVDCYYAYPGKKALLETIELCLKNIHMERILQNVPAVISISPDVSFRANKSGSMQELEMLNLKSSILEYCRVYHIDPVLKDDFGDVEMYLNTEQVGGMTGGYQFFNLPVWLKERVQFKGFVSIGADADLSKARFRAAQAREYGMRLGTDVSIFIDEKEVVHSLPHQAAECAVAPGVPASYVEQIANEAHLSSETVYRVIAAMQTEKAREFTSMDLVRVQGFSLRIATRVLTSLMEAGYAERVGQKRVGNKGRPQNLYRLNIEYEKGTVA